MFPYGSSPFTDSDATKSPHCALERDSPRDQLVVTLFLLTVFGLLLGAGIKGRMVKAGLDTSLPWNAGRRWWEVGYAFLHHPSSILNRALQAWVPQRQPESISLGDRSRDNSSRERVGAYERIFEAPESP